MSSSENIEIIRHWGLKKSIPVLSTHGLKHGLKYLKYQLCSIPEGYNKYGALYTITQYTVRTA
jgi:hypothetical protein